MKNMLAGMVLLGVVAAMNLEANSIVQSGIVGADQPCIINPPPGGQCPYHGGMSKPFCWQNPTPGDPLNSWDICVAQSNAAGGGAFTYQVVFDRDIVSYQNWNNVNCDRPTVDGKLFRVHCHCSGHCNIGSHWRLGLRHLAEPQQAQ